MNDKQRARRERILAGGKWRYVLLYGVLGWGLTCWFIVQGLTLLWNYYSHAQDWPHFIRGAAIDLVIWPVFGIWWGISLWNGMVRQHNSR
ncbi:MAG: hypothetical protein ACM3XM_00305 [Mycobacterium leprae]